MQLIGAVSLKTKLIAAVTIIVVIVLAAVGQAMLAVSRSDTAVTEAMTRQLPEALLVSELVRRTEAVLGAGRELAAARGEFDREGIMFVVQERLMALDDTITRLRGNDVPSPSLQRLEDNLGLFRAQIQSLAALSAEAQRQDVRLAQIARELLLSQDTASSGGQDALTKAAFLAAFSVVMAPEAVEMEEQAGRFARAVSGLRAASPATNGVAVHLETLILGRGGAVETRRHLSQTRDKVTIAVRKVDSQAQRLAAIGVQYQKEISAQTQQVVQSMHTATDHNRRILMVVAVVAVLAIAVLGYYLEVRVLSRLLKLRHAIDRFGTERAFDPAIGGHDEIAGIARAFVQLAREVSSRETQLVEIAHRDPLTGLANRRRFLERFEMVSRRRRPGDAALALLVIDIDHFKNVNDQHGHLAGDECLRSIARVIEQSIRTTDLVARFGGEEFLVLCTDVDTQSAAIVAEKIRAAVEKARVEIVGLPEALRVTVSIGVATVSPEAVLENVDFDRLMEAADTAVYDAKNGGRNCVRVADDLVTD